MKNMKVVVVGGGFGGLLTALFIAKEKQGGVEVVLIDAREHHVYTPWLYGISTAQLDSIAKRVRKDLDLSARISFDDLTKNTGVRFRQGRVTGVDHESKHVLLKNGSTVRYDKLVLAMGSTVNDFGIEGVRSHMSHIQDVEGALDLREDIVETFKRSKEGEMVTVAVVGSGPTGVESIGEIADFLKKSERLNTASRQYCRIVLLTASDDILMQLPKPLAKKAYRRLRKMGVEIITGARVSSCTKDRLFYAKSGREHALSFDVAVWAGGLRPTEAMKSFGLNLDDAGRVMVDQYFESSKKDVYVLGDVAHYNDPRRTSPMPGSAWVAVEEAKVLARNIKRAHKGKAPVLYRTPRYYPAVVSVGGYYAVSTALGFYLFGTMAFVLRRLVDLNYFRKILPLQRAVKHWWHGSVIISKD